jgi:hypothetical protein
MRGVHLVYALAIVNLALLAADLLYVVLDGLLPIGR